MRMGRIQRQTNMDEYEKQAQREADMEIVRREMERFSKDTIRIYNPLDFIFKYKWDSRNFSVPSKGTRDVERYLANAYAKKIIEYMIGQQQLAKGKELKELREKQLGKTFLDKYEENREVWDRVPKLDDQDLIKELGQTVIIGLVEEYGMEPLDEFQAPVERQETAYDSLRNLMNTKIVDGEPMKPYVEEENA